MSLWQKKEDRLGFVGGKVCIYGLTGSGKSTFAGTFPRINLVDAEDGQTYYLAENENILNVLPTTSASEVQEALKELSDEDMLEHYDTVVIDSGTKLNENMQAAAYEIVENRSKKQLAKNPGRDIDLDDLNLSMRDWGHIKRWNQELATTYINLANKGKWAVVTAHQKDITKEVGSGLNATRVVIGDRPDLAKKAEHDFDVILKTFIEQDPQTKKVKFFAEVKKDRTNVTKVGDVIENPSFNVWRERWESTRNLGIKDIDMSKDIEKSASTMQTEQDNLSDAITEFKTKMQELEKSDQTKVAKKLADLKIANPLKTDNLKGLKEVIEFINVL